MSRNKAVVGLFAILAAASAVGFGIMFSYLGRDACLDGSGSSASCPMLAIVNGERYGISAAPILSSIGPQLVEYGAISATNAQQLFARTTVYRVNGIDPAAVLVADAADPAAHGSSHVALFGPNRDGVWPAFCSYLPPDRLAAQPECE